MATKYWTGSGWVLDDGTSTTPPGSGDTAVLGAVIPGLTLPVSGTVSFAGTSAADVGTLSVAGGTWSITGTGGVGDTIVNLTVAMGATVTVDQTIAVGGPTVADGSAVGGITVEDVPGAAPASITLADGLPPNATIDFPGENVSYTTSFNGTDTTVSVTDASGTVANISLAGNVTLDATPVSDGNGGTELVVSGTQPVLAGAFQFIDDIGVNNIGFGTGDFLRIGDIGVFPNASQGTTLTATSAVNPATGESKTVTIAYQGNPAFPGIYNHNIAIDPTNPADAYELQPWTLTYTNGTSTETEVTPSTPSLADATPPPFAQDVTISGSGTNPTFNWSFPPGAIDEVFINIYDATSFITSGIASLVYSATPSVNASGEYGFTVPTAVDGGLTLQPGHEYVLAIADALLRNPGAADTEQNLLADTEAFYDFETINGQTLPIYLPTVTPSGSYSFVITTVVAGQTYYIDPAVATGYSYATGAGNPNFASVLLPTIQTSNYLVTFTQNGQQQTDSVAPGAVFSFGPGGVSSFEVTGIAAADNLDPRDATAFVTGLTFVANGEFTGTQTPLVDPGPTAGAVSASDTLGQTVDLTSAILAQVTPGLIGDTETITGFGPTADGGQVTLTNGDLTYTAQGGALQHIPANGSLTDSFTYTVTDENGDTATNTVSVTVSNPAVTINGNAFGFDTIHGGSLTNIVNAHGYFNTIDEAGGNDVVNAGAGFDTVNTGSGDVVTNLNGVFNQVSGGDGWDTVNIEAGGFNQVTLGSGNDTINVAAGSYGGNTFILNGSDASVMLAGDSNALFIQGGTDSITDNSQGMLLAVGPEGGNITLSNFSSDHFGVIDLMGGVGGYTSTKAIMQALQSDGHGGTLLSLGASGSIDFAGTPASSLSASRFLIEPHGSGQNPFAAALTS